MSELSGIGRVPVDVATGDSDAGRCMTNSGAAATASTNGSVNPQGRSQINGVDMAGPHEGH